MKDNITTDTNYPSSMSYTTNCTYSAYTVDDTFTMTATVKLDSAFRSGLSAYANNVLEETQGANLGGIICADLSGSELSLIEESGKMYYLGAATGFFSCFYRSYSQVGTAAAKSALNVMVEYLKSLSAESVNIATLKFTFTGAHSSYTKTVTQTINPSGLTYGVTEIELDKTGVTF